MRRLLLMTTALLWVVACRNPAPESSGGSDVELVSFTAHAVSRDARRLVVELRSESLLRGDVVVVWGETETRGRLTGLTARIPLPDVDAILPTPPPRGVPALGTARVLLRGRDQGGEATIDLGEDPAAASVREALVGAHARAVEAHRSAWLDSNAAEIEALRADGQVLASGVEALRAPIPRGRTAEESEKLLDLDASCGEIGPGMPGFTRRLEKAESALMGAVPGLPRALSDVPSAKRTAQDVRRACGFVRQNLERIARRTAAAEGAEATRARLEAKRRTRRAVAAVDLVEETLRGAVDDALLLRYEDALLDWGDAETIVLRLRAGEPETAGEARERAAEAKARVDALNASISLSLSGRSGQIGDVVRGAAKRLKTLSEDDREAVLGLFVPDLTPAGRILQQLVRDAAR